MDAKTQCVLLLLLLGVTDYAFARDRIYYVGIKEIDWDYTPSGRNLIYDREFNSSGYEADYILDGPDRIGSVYTKSVYRQYTDDTYSEEVPQPAHLGLLGPVLSAEVGDTIVIHFKNTGSYAATMHPHGVFYEKDSEGAIYGDQTSGKDKADDTVEPGDSHTYRWVANKRAGPTQDKDGCAHWLYHSHISTTVGTNSGLLGPILICREGFLRPDGSRRDVDRVFFLMLTVIDENLSNYIEQNVQKVTGNPDDVDLEDEGFVESNLMRSINGYMYGNLPGLDMCFGERVEWNVFCTGTEVDVHSISFYGNILEYNGHKEKTISITPAFSLNAYMTARSQGTWLLTSDVTTHILAGMQALYRVQPCQWTPSKPDLMGGELREYYIAAVEEEWDYAPTGMNGRFSLLDDSRPESIYFSKTGGDRIGGTYRKALFREFTDGTFTEERTRSSEEEHLGFLGPVIRAEAGDTIQVTFNNNASRPYSIHPSGVHYDKANEGAFYNDDSTEHQDDMVAPGSSYRYTWTVPDYLSPMELDDDCMMWTYQSHVDPVKDVYSGLIGPLLVCKNGTLEANKQKGIDTEFFLLFMNIDENLSHYLSENIAMYATDPESVDVEDEDFIESNHMRAINGYMYSNLPGLNACGGEDVVWHLASFGKETDMHMAVFEQQSMVVGGLRRDQAPLYPGTMRSFMIDNISPGNWSVYCHVATHYDAGTEAVLYVSDSCGSYDPGTGGSTRNVYYFAAEEIQWDYTPLRYDQVRSQSLDDPESPGNVFVSNEGPLLGSEYKKVVYRQYSDETFSTPLPREDSWGLLGNPIYTEVGEKFDVVFRNKATRSYGFYIHGIEWVNFDRSVEQEGIAPGEDHRYTFLVPEGEGLSGTEAACAPFLYTSVVDLVKDAASGLVGPLVVCREGILNNGRRTDVAKEFFLFFMVFDENKSWYLDENIEAHGDETVDKSDEEFEESNLMHGINGMLYCNLRGLETHLDEVTEWYLIGLGDEVDLHTVHFHGQTVVYRDEREHSVDVYELAPGVTAAVRMIPDDPGEWLLHCHVNDHILGGMEATFMVEDAVTTKRPMTTSQAAVPVQPVCATVMLILGVLQAMFL